MKTFLILLLLCGTAYADQCGCTRESEEDVCVAYYELADQGFDVKVTCKEEN